MLFTDSFLARLVRSQEILTPDSSTLVAALPPYAGLPKYTVQFNSRERDFLVRASFAEPVANFGPLPVSSSNTSADLAGKRRYSELDPT